MLGKLFKQFLSFCHFEILEIEARRDGTADQRIILLGITSPGGKPVPGRYYGLELLPCLEVRTQYMLCQGAVRGDYVEMDRMIACIEVPAFVAFDAVESRKGIAMQEKIYAGPHAAGAFETIR